MHLHELNTVMKSSLREELEIFSLKTRNNMELHAALSINLVLVIFSSSP
jgi:hypothetical protein